MTDLIPPLHYFINLLQKCRDAKNLSQAMRAHLHICYQGMDSHQDLAQELISVFVSCGSLPLSLQSFNKLKKRDEFAWISMISGFCSHGKALFSLTLSQEMEKVDGISQTKYTFIALLKVCVSFRHMNFCHHIHDEIIKKGIDDDDEEDLCVSNTLIDTYAKCSSILEAQEIFDKMKVRNVVSWTALMCGFMDRGYVECAIELCNIMQSEGISPNVVTYVCALKACASIGSIESGKNLHIEILKMGLENANRQRIGHILITFYSKSRMFEEARKIFDMLPVRNEVVWSSLISGYTNHGYGEEALYCFESMLFDGSLPNSITFLSCLKACGCIGALRKGLEIHSRIILNHVQNDVSVGCALVDMYIRCGSLERARVVFDGLLVRDVALWNALINGCLEHCMDENVCVLLEEMQLEGVNPDHETFASCVRACGSLQDIVKGQELHMDITKKGLQDEIISSTLVYMYGNCCLLSEAHELFSKMEDQDLVSWTSLIVGYCENGLSSETVMSCFHNMLSKGVCPDAFSIASTLKCCIDSRFKRFGQLLHMLVFKFGYENDGFIANTLVEMYGKYGLLADARQTFEKLLVRDVIAWSVMITSYVEKGEHTKAFSSYAQMQDQGVSPDSMTFLGILKACSDMGTLQIGREIHTHLWKVGFDSSNLFLLNALLDMYVKCGHMVDAQHIFDFMPIKDCVTWNTLLVGYSNGSSEQVFGIFERMKKEGISPDDVSFLTILSVCCHLGLVDDGKKYYEEMRSKYGIDPTIKHKACIVELLCNVGQLDVAAEMAQEESNIVAWTSVLDACRAWGNLELGKESFHFAVRDKS